MACLINTLRPRQNGRHFLDASFKWIFLNENVWISVEVSLTFVPRGPINNIPALVQIMAWRRPGDKPLSEPMMVSLLTHICVTRPQWVKDAIICTWSVLDLIQIMVCCLATLSETPLDCGQRDLNFYSFSVEMFLILTHRGRVTHICVSTT